MYITPIVQKNEKYYAAFKSHFGYNVMFREGKIYNLENRENYKFVLESCKDLINISYWIKLFGRKLKQKYLLKLFIKDLNKEIFFNNFFINRSIGVISICNEEMSKRRMYNFLSII